MNKNALLKLAIASILPAFALQPLAYGKASDPAALIKAGRQNLAKQTSDGIAAAHKNFSDAVKLAPNHAEVNLLYAATLFLNEHSAGDLHDQLQAGGIGVIDPSPYNYEISYPMDRLGRFAPFRYAGTKQTLSYLDSKSALCSSALACLQKITDSKFRVVLTEKETSLLGVTVDYGDVLLLRAALQMALAGLDLAKVYNLEAEYFWIYKRAITPGLTPEIVLKAYPQAMGFTNQAAKRVQAKTRLIAANSEIQAAYNFIKTARKPANPPNLGEVVDSGTAADLANFCKVLAQSLSGTVTLPNDKRWEYDVEGRQINLSKLFQSPSSPRLSLPESFDRGFIRPGSWKDSTVGGVFPDLKKDDLDSFALDYGILQNTSLEPYTFTTISGRAGVEGYMGSNSTALYGDLRGLTMDSAGNIYVADGRNHVIRKITPQGKVTDFVGKRWVTQQQADKLWSDYSKRGKFEEPSGIFYSFGGGLAFDSEGNFCFTANGILYKFTKAGKLIHFAGGNWEGAVRNGKGKNASFTWPEHIAAGKKGVLYVCDHSAVRKVDAVGTVTTLAGKLGWWWEGAEGYVDGVGSKARFDSLCGIAVDSAENIFVIDGDNHVIRKITANGTTTTFAGRLLEDAEPFDAVGSKALFGGFSWRGGLAIDKNGNLFLADNELVRKITPQAKVTTIGGKYRNYGRRDGTGESALFGDAETSGLAVDALGRVYVADETTVRRGTPAVNR